MRLLAALLLLPAPALADDCTLRLQSLLATDLTADGPYTAMNTNVMAGAEQTYRQSFVSDRHFLVEPISPPGLPATLHYEGAALQVDGAGGWTLAIVGYVVGAATNQVLELSYADVINGVPVTANYQISRAPGLTLPLPPGD